MTSTRLAAALLPVALLATALAPADDAPCREIVDPRDPEAVVELCEATGFFASTNPAKADNLSSVGATDFPTWVEEAPASVTGGSGAGFLGQYQSSLVTGPDEVSGVTYAGTFTGALDTIAVDQYVFTAAGDLNGVYGIVLDLKIDGETVYASDFVDGDFARISPGGDAVMLARFAIVDLFEDASLEDGEHTIEMNITPYFIGDEAVFVYGADEAPSSIRFNPELKTLGSYGRISATRG